MPKLSDYKLEELYKDLIDQTTPTVTIWGMEYDASRVLLEVDPIAYREGLNEWLDGLDDCEDCDKNPIDCECEGE